jgi:hypothetical protein
VDDLTALMSHIESEVRRAMVACRILLQERIDEMHDILNRDSEKIEELETENNKLAQGGALWASNAEKFRQSSDEWHDLFQHEEDRRESAEKIVSELAEDLALAKEVMEAAIKDADYYRKHGEAGHAKAVAMLDRLRNERNRLFAHNAEMAKACELALAHFDAAWPAPFGGINPSEPPFVSEIWEALARSKGWPSNQRDEARARLSRNQEAKP